MQEAYFLRIFNLIAGAVGVAISIGVLLFPQALSKLEKKLDKGISLEGLEKKLNERKNLSETLLRHPKIFGLILLVISFLLVVSAVTLF